MFDFLSWALQGYGALCALSICVAAIKASLMHDGPDLFELVGMLWRGEIKTRKAQ